ncbi:ABC transporter permease OS=Lysinibacillus sphaericus OX=1421 GN=LS41612_00700 PE=4 SV=1 [Lysinibacillus sphaericus]
MDLIDAYIYEVIRRIPKKKRDAIGVELKSTIEDMLPEDFSELEVKEALLKLGDPAILAASYQQEPKYLIGPELYSTYMQTIKVVLPWAILITIIVLLVKSIFSFPADGLLLSAIIQAISLKK